MGRRVEDSDKFLTMNCVCIHLRTLILDETDEYVDVQNKIRINLLHLRRSSSRLPSLLENSGVISTLFIDVSYQSICSGITIVRPNLHLLGNPRQTLRIHLPTIFSAYRPPQEKKPWMKLKNTLMPKPKLESTFYLPEDRHQDHLGGLVFIGELRSHLRSLHTFTCHLSARIFIRLPGYLPKTPLVHLQTAFSAYRPPQRFRGSYEKGLF